MRQGYFVITFLVNTVVTVVEVFLGLRFLLKLLGANPVTPFVDWVYDTSRPLLEPFVAMFPAPVIDGRYILEFTTLFAIIVYAVASWLVLELIRYIYRATEPRERREV